MTFDDILWAEVEEHREWKKIENTAHEIGYTYSAQYMAVLDLLRGLKA